MARIYGESCSRRNAIETRVWFGVLRSGDDSASLRQLRLCHGRTVAKGANFFAAPVCGGVEPLRVQLDRPFPHANRENAKAHTICPPLPQTLQMGERPQREGHWSCDTTCPSNQTSASQRYPRANCGTSWPISSNRRQGAFLWDYAPALSWLRLRSTRSKERDNFVVTSRIDTAVKMTLAMSRRAPIVRSIDAAAGRFQGRRAHPHVRRYGLRPHLGL